MVATARCWKHLQVRSTWPDALNECEGITKVITNYPQRNVNVGAKFQDNSSNICQDTSLQIRNRGKVRGAPKSWGFILWEAWTSVQNLIAIHPIAVEIFWSGPKWWNDWLVDYSIHPAGRVTKESLTGQLPENYWGESPYLHHINSTYAAHRHPPSCFNILQHN